MVLEAIVSRKELMKHPLMMLFLMWVHIQRLSRPKVNPPQRLALGSLIMLLVLSFVKPALSQGPADLATVPAVVNFDWFYLVVYPLLLKVPGAMLWLALGSITVLLLALPWLPPPSPAQPGRPYRQSTTYPLSRSGTRRNSRNRRPNR